MPLSLEAANERVDHALTSQKFPDEANTNRAMEHRRSRHGSSGVHTIGTASAILLVA